MIRFEIAFHDLDIFLGGQGMKDLAKAGTDVAIEAVLSHLGNEDDMILAVPLGVRQAVVNQ
jgi:hypothetical protein